MVFVFNAYCQCPGIVLPCTQPPLIGCHCARALCAARVPETAVWIVVLCTALSDSSRAVPFGCAGYAYVDEKLRSQRGRPKHLRAEPAVCVGYQHMYSDV